MNLLYKAYWYSTIHLKKSPLLQKIIHLESIISVDMSLHIRKKPPVLPYWWLYVVHERIAYFRSISITLIILQISQCYLSIQLTFK